MKNMKKIISGVLCSAVVAGSSVGVAVGLQRLNGQAEDLFIPVFRMAVCSDTHVTPANTALQEKFERFFTSSYDYAENHAYYKQLDAVVVTGDLTHTNRAVEMRSVRDTVVKNLKRETAFLSMVGNHDLYDSATGTDLGTNDNSSFINIMDYRLDQHIEVNGFHLISVSNETSAGDYADSSMEWLKEQVASAVKDDPNKPIFTFQHFHLTDSVFNSKAPSDSDFPSTMDSAYFDEAFAPYSQVVNFSGHSHGAGNSTRSIYQKDYTVVDVPAFFSVSAGTTDTKLSNFFATGNQSLSVKYSDKGANMFRIVEVDADNKVRIYTYDMYEGGLCKTASTEDGDAVMYFEIDNVKDKDSFRYTDEKYQDTTAPVWAAGSALTVQNNGDGTATVSFPQALEDNCMFGYKVSVIGENYNEVYNFLDDYYVQSNIAGTMESFLVNVPAEAGQYTITVSATNVWGLTGALLTATLAV